MKGTKWVNDCMHYMIKVNELSLMMLTESEKKTAANILVKVDRFHTQHYNRLKSMNAHEIWKYNKHANAENNG